MGQPDFTKAPQLEFSRGMIGKYTEIFGSKDDPDIMELSKATKTSYGPAENDEVPWCGFDLCYVLMKTGHKYPRGGAAANSFIGHGIDLKKKLIPGCGLVFQWANGHFHVSMLDHLDPKNPNVLYAVGGNQENQHKVTQYDRKWVVYSFWPVPVDGTTPTNPGQPSTTPNIPEGGAFPTIRKGATGQAVEALQSQLIHAGYDPGPVDGDFGPVTEKAVLEFQKNAVIKVDGIVGPQTWGALKKAAGGAEEASKEPVKHESSGEQALAKPPAPLPFEKNHPEKAGWSAFIFTLILRELLPMFNQAKDVTDFNKNYHSFNDVQKAHFWSYFLSWVMYHECGWNPTSRMRENTMGTDPVTGQHIYSEGLFQLSYQDTQSYKSIKQCQLIDWGRDKGLDAHDPKKTILDPIINADCGIRIMAWHINKEKCITGPKHEGAAQYWAVLRQGHSELADIKKHCQEFVPVT